MKLSQTYLCEFLIIEIKRTYEKSVSWCMQDICRQMNSKFYEWNLLIVEIDHTERNPSKYRSQ